MPQSIVSLFTMAPELTADSRRKINIIGFVCASLPRLYPFSTHLSFLIRSTRLCQLQLHDGLALVRSNEAWLGVSQGPILASLIRLSLVLLCNLEPSSINCLQCCSRRLCFLHWSLASIHGIGWVFGYVPRPHRSLGSSTLGRCSPLPTSSSRCSAVLSETASSPLAKFFHDDEAKIASCFFRVERIDSDSI
jgi:hypothetical protein